MIISQATRDVSLFTGSFNDPLSGSIFGVDRRGKL